MRILVPFIAEFSMFLRRKGFSLMVLILPFLSSACSAAEEDQCRSDRTCPDRQVCIDEVCADYELDSETKTGLVDSCTSDLHCSDGQSCMFGQCIIRRNCIFGTKGDLLCETHRFEPPCENASVIAAKDGYVWVGGPQGKFYKTTQSGDVVDLVNAPTSRPGGLAGTDGGFWYADTSDEALYLLTDDFEIVDTVELDFRPDGDIASDGTHAFVSDYDAGILRVGMDSALKQIDLQIDMFWHAGIAFDGNGLWTTNSLWEYKRHSISGQVTNVFHGDDVTGSPTSYGDGDSRVLAASAVTWDETAMWALNDDPFEDEEVLVRRFVEIAFAPEFVELNLLSMDVPPTFVGGVFASGAGDLCWDGSNVWQASPIQMKVFKFNEDLEVLQSLDVPGSSVWGIACNGQHVWTLDYEEGVVFSITHGGEPVSQIDAPGMNPLGLSFDGEALWTSSWEPNKDKESWNRIIRFTPAGKILNSFYVSGQCFMSAIESDGLFVWLIDGAWYPAVEPCETTIRAVTYQGEELMWFPLQEYWEAPPGDHGWRHDANGIALQDDSLFINDLFTGLGRLQIDWGENR